MFVAVARVTLSIPESGSLKGKRQVVRRVIDRVKARFNVSISEVGEQEIWQRAVLGVAAVANDSTFAQQSIEKVLRFIDEMYVAPVIARETEIIPMGGDLYGEQESEQIDFAAALRPGNRTLAEAEAAAGGPEEPPFPVRRGNGRHEHGGKGRHRHGRSQRGPMSEEERERAIEALRERMRAARGATADADWDDDQS